MTCVPFAATFPLKSKKETKHPKSWSNRAIDRICKFCFRFVCLNLIHAEYSTLRQAVRLNDKRQRDSFQGHRTFQMQKRKKKNIHINIWNFKTMAFNCDFNDLMWITSYFMVRIYGYILIASYIDHSSLCRRRRLHLKRWALISSFE